MSGFVRYPTPGYLRCLSIAQRHFAVSGVSLSGRNLAGLARTNDDNAFRALRQIARAREAAGLRSA